LLRLGGDLGVRYGGGRGFAKLKFKGSALLFRKALGKKVRDVGGDRGWGRWCGAVSNG